MSQLDDSLRWYQQIERLLAKLALPSRVQPHLLENNVHSGTISATVINQAQAYASAGDRGAAYLLLAEATGNPFYLSAAQVSTASGPILGGPALQINARLQVGFPGIYPNFSVVDFSNAVIAGELSFLTRAGNIAVQDGQGNPTASPASACSRRSR